MAVVRDAGTRQDTFVVRLYVAGNSFGVWDKKSGGELDSDEVKYYGGDMVDAQSLGGRVTPGNITLSRLYDRIDDHDRIQLLLQAVGKSPCTVSQRPKTINGNSYGKTIVWKGKFKRVMIPDVDSESTSAAMIEVEISVEGRPTIQ